MAEASAADLEVGVRNLSVSDGENAEPFQLTLDVLTANIKGDKTPTPRDRQKDILEHFFHEHQPDVILVQENLWPGDNIKSHLASIGGNYDAENIPKKYETVLHRFTNFPKLEAKGNNLHQELENACRENKLVLNHGLKGLLERARIVSFAAKGPFAHTPEPHLIAISWHGPTKCPPRFRSRSSTMGERKSSGTQRHSRSSTGETDVTRYKKEVFCDLLETVTYLNSRLYSKRRVPVILGGDFNMDYGDVQEIIRIRGLLTKRYTMLPSRENLGLLDFFIVSTEVSLNGVYAIPYEMDPGDKIFHHAPVLARLTLSLTVPKVRKKNGVINILCMYLDLAQQES